MRRPAALTVETSGEVKGPVYELSTSPASTVHALPPYDAEPTHDLPEKEKHQPEPAPAQAQAPTAAAPVAPSVRLLFSSLRRRDALCFVLPAVLTSAAAGAVAPIMTRVIGNQFNVFGDFPSHHATEADKRALLHGVGLAALELLALAVAALVLSSTTSSLWICAGERNVSALRKRVFARVAGMDMAWFDTQMGTDGAVHGAEDGPIGAGGLMAKFARETDEVRAASSLACGFLIQYITTTLACLALAFSRSWSLTLVILSAVPALIVIQIVSQVFAGRPLAVEQQETAAAATLLDRAAAAVATVKAFNAQAHELAALGATLARVRAAADACNAVWALTAAASQFATYAMFIQGFWFGATLVRAGRVSSGDVMAVFWACLIATSNLQMAVPQLLALAKGKFAAAALLSTAAGSAGDAAGKEQRLRKIRPTTCAGELALHHVSFAYPGRPDVRVLDDVSLYVPAGELTFVVGGSGSGKSTVAQLLQRAYAPAAGAVTLDEQDAAFLDASWTRAQVACVSQQTILFDRSVHDNVALGLVAPGSLRRPEDASRAEVEAACRAAMMHEFVRDLPDGYDTLLGTAGASLSGGQKQRLAIARALLRNPTVLILDEATSALDATSRVLVFEALKRRRRNMTTVVITHDLSQVEPADFVYVLRRGRVAEQGFRADLEADAFSTFREMADQQGALGGFPVRDLDAPAAPAAPDAADALALAIPRPPTSLSVLADAPAQRLSGLPQLHRLTLSNWMFDAVADLATPTAPHAGFVSMDALQFTPTTPAFHFNVQAPTPRHAAFDADALALAEKGERASRRRPQERRPRTPVNDREPAAAPAAPLGAVETQLGFWRLMREIYPTVPNKPLVAFGLLACLASGAMTPVFSFLLSRVMYEVSIGAGHVSTINVYGAAVLAAAAADGLFMGLKFFVMEKAAMAWVTDVRKRCLARVLAQDKAWFDRAENAPARLVQILVKDGDDARALVATVLSQLLVVVAMLAVGLVWALVWGWQLTLVGFAVAPVFAVVMAVQTRLVSQCELRNKRAKEDVSKWYYEMIANIRGIRAMGFEDVFEADFRAAADRALATGVRGAFFEGIGFGLASALIYLAEAVLFYTGAVLVAKGTYTYLQMIDVLNLVVFTVTIGSQLMTFTERIAKSLSATNDFNRLLQLPTDTAESKGTDKPEISGTIAFKDVEFAYPERPDMPVLKGLSMELRHNECVAVVGASGSGKSTVAALLQRLYEPAAGTITIDGHDIRHTDVAHLREHVAIVSQQPNLFHASIAENIAYGRPALARDAVQRAAMDASVHDFVAGLPQGYDTPVGENAALISGGQAQRIQIARALARPARVLVLDECTSALDAANQAAVVATIQRAKVGRAALMITHKVPVMRMCDRIVVVADGRVVEEGSFDELVARNGQFAQLARGGEWEH